MKHMNKNFAELSLGASLYMLVVVISIAIGVYGTARVTLNTIVFEKYPVSSMMPMMYGGYYQSEADCTNTSLYYAMDGLQTREPTEQERMIDDQRTASCLDTVKESRKMSMVSDIGGAILSLGIGIGLMLVKKHMFKSA